MDTNALYKISYGLYVLSARENSKDNACIINTAMQVSSKPTQLGICVNKLNYTHDMIVKTNMFTVSILSETTNFDLFKHFGFASGKDVDKFKDYDDCKRATNGLFYITKGSNAYISVNVNRIIDLDSHSMFIGEISETASLNDEPSLTYAYYLEYIKPKTNEKKKEHTTVWRCKICGWEYVGETIPEDFICPICKHPASDFEKIVY